MRLWVSNHISTLQCTRNQAIKLGLAEAVIHVVSRYGEDLDKAWEKARMILYGTGLGVGDNNMNLMCSLLDINYL